jgi:hypothetical protein
MALGLVYGLLALAVFVAMIGIVNRLLLSVVERAREVGLFSRDRIATPAGRADDLRRSATAPGVLSSGVALIDGTVWDGAWARC